MANETVVKNTVFSFLTMNILDISLDSVGVSLASAENALFSLIIGVIFHLLKYLFTREKGVTLRLFGKEILKVKIDEDGNSKSTKK